MATTSCKSDAATVMADISSLANTENVPQEVLGSVGKVIGKLSGTNIDYCMKKDKVVIGRNSANEKVDVDVGLSSYVSRKHLEINYERGRFFLVCLGKNGVFIDGQFQRLGSNPIPLDQACVIRFPSTSICLSFNPQQSCNNSSNQPIVNVQSVLHSAVENEPLSCHTNVSSSLSQNESSLYAHQPQIGARTFPSPPLKHVAHGFLSAPPSPTGTISAVNSCPSSPKRATFHANQNRRVTADLHAAASAIAASVGKQSIKCPTDLEGSDAKPPYSYAQLIVQAISSAPLKQLTLSGIYAHITKNYLYYKAADKGWQNSIRHNLSLNRYFVKVPRSQEESGKGSFWKIDSQSEKKLVEQAWRKRRQRAVPCISTSLPLSDFAVIRSAPVSPDRSNTISPLSSSQGAVFSSQTNIRRHEAGAGEKPTEVKVDARYAQSAPGSPTGHGRLFAIDTSPNIAGDTSSIVSASQQHDPAMTSVGVVSLADNEINKVIWPLQSINPSGNKAFTALTTSVPYQDAAKKYCVSNSTAEQPTTALPETSSTSSVMQSTSASSTSVSAQLLQQQQKYQQQLVMVAGRSPQIVHHAIPVNIGTLIAAPSRFVNPNVPFVVPAPVAQQYLAKRASGETTAILGVVQPKKTKAEDNRTNGSPTRPSD